MNNAIMLAASAEKIDFMIHGLVSYQLFGQTFWITTTHVCVLIVMLILIFFALAVNRRMKNADEIPKGFQNAVELIVEMLDKMVAGAMGRNSKKFVNYISTIFIFILISNISGIFGLRPPTADYGTTFAMGLMTFTIIHYNQFKHQKIKGVVKGLCEPWPFWLPINLIGEIAVPISMSLRLFANILSGTVMMSLIYGLLGWIATFWPAVLHIYFDLFAGAIQTYVFCMLTMTYVNNAIVTE